jgi:hypothetical protein
VKRGLAVFVLLVFSAIGLASGLTACNQSSPGPKEQLRQKLRSATNKEIASFLYDDYDGDGKYEAFALASNSEKSDHEEGEAWFVSENELLKLDDTDWLSPPQMIRIDDGKFVKYEKIYATGRDLLLLCVEDGKPKAIISGGAQYLEQLDDGSFTVRQNTLDGMSDGTGRTLKPYWLYYNNGFREYGGIAITEAELLEFNGADSVLKQIKADGGVLQNILYRENHIININYQTPQGENRYVNLKYDDTSVSVRQTDGGSGVYLAALLPEIATYPAKFQHPNGRG